MKRATNTRIWIMSIILIRVIGGKSTVAEYTGDITHVMTTPILPMSTTPSDNDTVLEEIDGNINYRMFRDKCLKFDRSADTSHTGRICTMVRVASYDFPRRLTQFEKMLNMYILGPPFSDTITITFNRYVTKANLLGRFLSSGGTEITEIAKNLTDRIDADRIEEGATELKIAGTDLISIGKDDPENPKEFPDFMKQWSEEGIVVDTLHSTLAEKDMMKVLIHIEEAHTIITKTIDVLGNATDLLRKVTNETKKILAKTMQKIAKGISNYYESAFAQHCRVEPDADQHADKSYAGRMCIIERHAYELEETEQYLVYTMWNDAADNGLDIPGYITNTTQKRSKIRKLSVEQFNEKAMAHLKKVSEKFRTHGGELIDKSEKIIIAGRKMAASAVNLDNMDASNIELAAKATVAFGKDLGIIGKDHLSVVAKVDELEKDDHDGMMRIVSQIKKEGPMFVRAGRRLAQASTILRHMSAASRHYIFHVIEELYLYGGD